MKSELLILVTALSVSIMGCAKTPKTQAEIDAEAKQDNLNTCFMVSVKAAKEGSNDAPRESPEYKEIYKAAFDVCLKQLETKSVDATKPTPVAPAPVAPQSKGGAALESCVMSGKCDDDTTRMLNRVGAEIYGK